MSAPHFSFRADATDTGVVSGVATWTCPGMRGESVSLELRFDSFADANRMDRFIDTAYQAGRRDGHAAAVRAVALAVQEAST